MIIFYKDWKKYPKAVIDTETNNESFIKLALLLKKMEIKNHAFCLALHNPKLKGVDPHNPDITPEEIAMVAEECSVNPWYIFREVIRVPAKSSSVNPPLRLNRGNVSLFWLFFVHVTTMLIQPRQTGKSLSTDVLMVALKYFLTLNTEYNLLTKDDSLRVNNIKRLKELGECLPPYLQIKNKKDTNNTEKITLNALGNIYNSSVAQSSVKAAFNLGRGMTTAINHIDEIAFINNIETTLPVMLAASGAARDEAKANRAPYGNIFTTTPGYLNIPSGKYAYEVYQESLPWSEKLFDCEDEETLRDTIAKNNHGIVQVLLEYNHRQLGYTDEWLKEKINDAKAKGENIGADFLNLWATGGSKSSPLSKENIRKINNSTVNDPYVEVTDYGYIINWYVPQYEVDAKLKNRKLIAGLDTSEAIGKDDIALVIIDAYTGATIATGRYNQTNTITFSEWLTNLLVRFPNITLIPEKKSTGRSIIDNLLKLLPIKNEDPYRRVFNWYTNDCKLPGKEDLFEDLFKRDLRDRDPRMYDKYRDKIGYGTASGGRASRDNLYGKAYTQATRYLASSIKDKALIRQIVSVIVKNNRIDHNANENDDMCIAWLLAYWFLTEADNKDIYGIDTKLVLTNVKSMIVDENGGIEAIAKRNRQNKIRNKINYLIEEMKISNSRGMKLRIHSKIKMLYNQLDPDFRNTLSLDGLIEEMKLINKHINRRVG